MSKPDLTILVPAYNEEESIVSLVEEVFQKTAGRIDVEVIVIDDGSDDGTNLALQSIAEKHVALKLITHPVRSGKTAALRTGAAHAQAIWIGTMDGDGQDDPADLVKMAGELDLKRIGAVGLVGGVRRQRTDGDSRKFASRFANGLRRTLLNDDCPDTACGLKIIPRDLFMQFPFFDALHRYLPAFTRHYEFETIYVKVDNRPRIAGVSKYTNIGRAFAGLFDLMGVMWLMRRSHAPVKHFLQKTHNREEGAD